jgi:hypothetical protein
MSAFFLRLAFSYSLVFAGLTFVPEQAHATTIVPTYCVCIGEHRSNCPHASATFNGVGYVCVSPFGYFDCNFAYAHAVQTDLAANRVFCSKQNPGFVRVINANGDRCGYIIDLTTC